MSLINDALRDLDSHKNVTSIAPVLNTVPKYNTIKNNDLNGSDNAHNLLNKNYFGEKKLDHSFSNIESPINDSPPITNYVQGVLFVVFFVLIAYIGFSLVANKIWPPSLSLIPSIEYTTIKSGPYFNEIDDDSVNTDAMKHTNSLKGRYKIVEKGLSKDKDLSSFSIDYLLNSQAEPRVDVSQFNLFESRYYYTKKDIDLLIKMAKFAFLEKKYTTPKGSSAFEYYSRVLSMNPENKQAQKGVLSIQYKYKDLIRLKWDQKDEAGLQKFIKRYLYVGGDLKNINNINKDNLDLNTNDSNIIDVSSDSVNLGSVNLASVSSGDIMPISSRFQEQGNDQQKDHTSIFRTDKQKEIQFFNRIKKLSNNNQLGQAIVEVEMWLNDGMHLSAQTAGFVFDLYLSVGDTKKAKKVSHYLNSEKEEGIWDATYEKARLIHVEQGEKSALAYYSSHNITTLSEISKRFYAGLLQKNKEYDRAKEIYEELVVSHPYSPMYWLGLAVSSDGLRQPVLALQSYEKALVLGGLSSDLQQYSTSRVSSLRQDIKSTTPFKGHAPW